MIDDHVHQWEPVPGACACYACACGAVGCRSSNGEIHEIKHATEIDPGARITARPIADAYTGRVRRVHVLDDWDFWEAQQEL